MTWGLFSLEEINRDTVSAEYLARLSAVRPALRTLALALREHGNDAVDRLYLEMGEAVHVRKESLAEGTVVDSCVTRAGLPTGLREAAIADPWTDQYLVDQHRALTSQKAFGVPTIVLPGASPVFGPVIDDVPTGASAVELWDAFESLAGRPDFFELKRER